MNLETLEEVLRLLSSSRIVELEMESGDDAIHLRRILKAPVPTGAASPTVTPADEAEDRLTPVEAGFVGRFHYRENPPAVGDEVAEGETLGDIDSMGLANHVVSPVSGRIITVHVEDAQPVEYGQILFEIDPV